MDVRVGGSWRFVAENRQGTGYVFRGQYLEVDPPKRLVQTMENGWMAGAEWTETMQFEDLDGTRTRFTQTSVFATSELRDMVLRTAETGANYTFSRLDQLLAQRSYSNG